MTYLQIARNYFSIILLYCSLSIHFANAAGLNGKYTIDKSKPATSTNYLSFNDADSDLTYGTRASGAIVNGPGVVGPVVFEVANGSYHENLRIGRISGTSSKNTIEFRSASKDSSKVILIDTTTWSIGAGYVLHLDSASFIRFHQLTFLRPFNPSPPSFAMDHVIMVDNLSDSDTISNCMIIGNYNTFQDNMGSLIYSEYTATGTSKDEHNAFINNNLSNGYSGIRWVGGGASVLDENGNAFIHNTIDSCFEYGMFIGNQIGANIIGNIVIMRYGYTGIYAYKLNFYGKASTLVANNFVSVGTSSNPVGIPANYGVYVYNSNSTDIVNNSVNLYGYSPKSIGIYGEATAKGKALNIHNNISINSTKSPGAHALGGNYFSNETYNDLVSAGEMVYYNNKSYATLAKWLSSSLGFGAHDTSINPIFVSSNNLHVYNPNLDALGKSLFYLTQDIDGEKRDTISPDMGADEFEAYHIKPTIYEITNPTSGFCTGIQDVNIGITNFGLDTLKEIIIKWDVNGVAQKACKWNGTFLSTDSLNVKIGTYNFASPTTVYKIRIYIDSVNGGSLLTPFKDTFKSNAFVGLKGTFLIDNSGVGAPDYNSMRAAVNELNRRGVCGAVTFNIADGVYNESIQIDKFKGSSSLNKVIFQSFSGDSSKVKIDTACDGTILDPFATVNVNGASYVTFRKLSIINSAVIIVFYGGYADAIYIKGAGNNISIENCNLWVSRGEKFNYGAVIADGPEVESFITIRNNHISGGYEGIRLIGDYNVSEKGHIIEGNFLDSSWGLNINGYYLKGFNISRNKILISGLVGVGNTALSIYGNPIADADTNYIANNFISGDSNTGNAVYLYDVSPLYFSSNSISNTSALSAVSMYGSYTSNVSILRNNIISAIGGGYALEASSGGISSSDHNDFYSNGKSIAFWKDIKTGSTKNCMDIATWNSVSKMDKNSISVEPGFKSISTCDLHLNIASPLASHNGIALSSIADDIDGEKRNSKRPNMGADETPFFANDVALLSIDSPEIGFCSGLKNVYVKMLNVGYDTLKNLNLEWQVNGFSRPTISWSGVLPPLKTTIVKLDTVSYVSGTNKTIKIWSKNPNASIDSNAANDTLKRITGMGLNGAYTIGGIAPDYSSFRDAVRGLEQFGVCGKVTFNVRDGYYNECLNIKPVAGASVLNPVIFQSQSLDSTRVILDTIYSLKPNSHGYTVCLDGASYITFRKMTISNYALGVYIVYFGYLGYGDVFILRNNASYNTVENSLLFSEQKLGVNIGSLISNDPVTAESWNTVRNNLLSGNCYAILFRGTKDAPEKGNVILNNHIDSFWYGGIAASHQQGIEISNNKLFTDYGYTGIDLSNSHDPDTSFITNNFITLSGYGLGVYGINSYSNQLLGVFNNSINSSSIYGACASYTSKLNCKVIAMNNIYQNSVGGLAIYADDLSLYSSDYNDLASPSTTNIATFVNTKTAKSFQCASLADWQKLTKKDTKSVSGDPAYLFFNGGDLHLTDSSLVVKNHGIYIPRTRMDIDGQPRNKVAPDIGADEVPISPNDAGVLLIRGIKDSICPGSISIYVTIKNYGTDTLKNVSVNSSINGVLQTPLLWKGSLAWKESDTSILLGAYYFKGGVNKIKVWTSKPNGKPDTIKANDSFNRVVNLLPLPNPIIIGKQGVCTGDSGIYSIATSLGSKYTWGLQKNAILEGQNTDSVLIKWKIQGLDTLNVSQTDSSGCLGVSNLPISVGNPVSSHFSIRTISPYIFHADDTTLSKASYTWNFGDSSSANGYMVTHNYSNSNLRTITLSINNKGCSTSFDTSLKVFTGESGGFLSEGLQVSIYPNPMHDYSVIALTINEKSTVNLSIFDARGVFLNILASGIYQAGVHTIIADREKLKLPAGAYIVQLNVNDRVIKKLMIIY